MKICLINPPQILNKRFGRPFVFQPLGLLYIAAVLEKKYKVEVIDASLGSGGVGRLIEQGNNYYLGLSFAEIRQRISAMKPDVVGISMPFSINERSGLEIASLVKEIDSNIVTILGGAHVSVRPRETLSSAGVDFAVIGEGEITIMELLEVLTQGSLGNFREINGIGFKEGGEIVLTPMREKIQDLDSIPFPARHLVPMEEYFAAMKMRKGAREMYTFSERWTSLITSRGCPYHCNFCSIHLSMGREFRKRSAENVIAEIKEVKKLYDIKHINFEDDNLTLDKERAGKIFELMIENSCGVSWSAPNGLRSDALDEELIGKMRQSGCRRVFVAPESGVQRVVTSIIKKNMDLNKIEEAVVIFKKYGIIVDGSFVIGSIGETKDDIRQTIKYALRLKRLGLDTAGFHIATPYYGTELYQEALQKGFLNEYSDSGLFTTTEPLIETPEWTKEEIKQLREMASRAVNFNLKDKILYFLWGCPLIWRFLKRVKQFIVNVSKLPKALYYWFYKWGLLFGNVFKNILFNLTHQSPKVEYLVYEVTDACNSSCKHCSIWKHKPTENILLPQEMEKILGDSFFDNLKVVLLTGGEPILRQDIKELISSIHQARPLAAISLSTNAILPERILDTMNYAIANGIRLNVGISLDAIGPRHDLMRGVKGNFEKVEYLLKELTRLKEKYPDQIGAIIVGHTLSNLTVDTLKEVMAYAQRLKIGFLTQLYEEFIYYHNVENKDINNYHSADNTSLIKALSELPPSFHNELLINALKQKLKFKCAALRKFFLLRCDGSVAPCLYYSDVLAGNVRSHSLQDIWKGLDAGKARKIVADCRGCSNSWATAWSMENWFFPFFWLIIKSDLKYYLGKLKERKL